MLNCGKCGASVTETAIYCSLCGHKLADAGSPAPTPKTDFPLTKAASALAKASGLAKSQSNSRFGLLVRALSIAAGALLVLSAYLVYRNQSSAGTMPVLNILAPLDKVNQLVKAGELSLEQGDFKTAIARFEEAERHLPNHTDVIKKLADAYESDGQIDNALLKYSRVLEIDAMNLEARFQRAELQLNRGVWEKAAEDFQYLLTNAPTSEQADIARAILSKATAKRSLDSLPDRHPLMARRGKHGLQLPEVDDIPPRLALTLPNLVSGVPVTPPSSSATEDNASANALARQHKDKGKNYLSSKMYYSAINQLHSARKLAPDDSDLNYLLGQAYDGLKQYGQARKYYELCDSGVYLATARNAAERAKKNEQKQAKKNRKEEKTDD
jgi:tetratricopeptide (TPR) repeat protein